MKKVLITGADGFIGRHLVTALLDNGVEVCAIVYPGNNIYNEISSEKLSVIEMDLNEVLNNINVFPNEIDVMYHYAWAGVKPEQRDDTDVQFGNIDITLKCMKLAIALGVKKVVLPGSTNEYLYCGTLINKEAQPSPNNAYGATKVALRYLCGSYLKCNNIDFIYAVITGIYADDRRDNNVIFYTIDKLLHGESPKLTKLEQLWDYVYIDDVIDAFIAIGERGKNGAVYAIGHGDNWALKEYIEIIHKLINPNIPLGIGEIPYPSDILPSSCIDLTDLKHDTGFIPKVGFYIGIQKVIDNIKSEMGKEDGE